MRDKGRRPRRSCLLAALVILAACGWDGRRADPYDLDFDIPRTEDFAPTLSAYALYQEPMASLEPAADALVYELSSELFTDYAHKQRLLLVPEGESITVTTGETLNFPEGTILAKTFYYPEDMRDAAGARRIIETRLLVKRGGTWNVATYLWNDEQSEATLLLEGSTTQVSWIDASGAPQSTQYAVPHEGECVTCHQSEGESVYIGPTLANLNRSIVRDGGEVNQLAHLQTRGVLDEVDWASAPTTANYRDESLPLATRARAYLDINCAHCHRPGGWDEATERDFDFRYSTPLDDTGLVFDGDKLTRALERGEMPYLGTTMLHAEGIDLVLGYLESL